MKILLTGAKRVGKTTLLKDLLTELNPDFWIIAHETKNSAGERNGFAAETSTGFKGQFAYRLSDFPGVQMGNYKVDLAAVNRLYSEPIRAATKPGNLLVIDEIGRIQMLSSEFQTTIRRLFDSNANLIAIIPEPGDWTKVFDSWLGDFTSRPDVTNLTLTPENRPEIRKQIREQILSHY